MIVNENFLKWVKPFARMTFVKVRPDDLVFSQMHKNRLILSFPTLNSFNP